MQGTGKRFGKGRSRPKHRGPRHGHGNKGKSGGGNAYGTNNINMTISQAKKLYANQLAEGISLQDAMRHNKAETVSYWDLLDDKGDTKKSNSDTMATSDFWLNKDWNNTNSTNNMTTKLSDKDWLKGAYKEAFGQDREANFDAKGGAQYWLDQMASNPTSHSRDEVLRMLKGSDEGLKYAGKVAGWDRAGKVSPGGVDPTKSIHSSFLNDSTNDWLQKWAPGGSLAPDNVDDTFTDVNKSLSAINPTASYFNFDDNTFTGSSGGGGGGGGGTTPPPGLTIDDLDKWWDAKNKDTKDDNGMGDFMKFMMLMSVMGGGRGMGGGGYQGSQYGYGGLTPGGVQAAYDPMKYLTGMGTWFKDNFGSGGSSSSSGDSASSSSLNLSPSV